MNQVSKKKNSCRNCGAFKSIVESNAYKEAMTLKSLVGYDNILRVNAGRFQIRGAQCPAFARQLDDDFRRLDYDKMYGDVRVLLVAVII